MGGTLAYRPEQVVKLLTCLPDSPWSGTSCRRLGLFPSPSRRGGALFVLDPTRPDPNSYELGVWGESYRFVTWTVTIL